MTQLAPCSVCTRHVRSTDTACPFCGTPFSPAIERRPRPPRGLGRSALAAWGATFAFTAACGGGPEPAPAYGGPPDDPYVEQPAVLEEEPVEEIGDGEEVETTPEESPPDEDTQEESMPAPAYGGPPPS